MSSRDVVWANQGLCSVQGCTSAAIAKVPLQGGRVEVLVALDHMPTSIVLDSGYIYWTTYNTFASDPSNPGPLPDGAVMKMPLAGGGPTQLASGQVAALSLGVHAGNLYWTAQEGIMTVPTTGGTATVFAAGKEVHALTLGANRVYWVDEGYDASEPSVRSAVSIRAKPFDGGETLMLGEGPSVLDGMVMNLVASKTDLYWTREGQRGAVQKLPIGGGTLATVYTADDDDLDLGIAVDADNLYWMNTYRPPSGLRFGRLMKVPFEGGEPVELAPTSVEMRYMALDATSVYFTDRASGSVMRLTPK